MKVSLRKVVDSDISKIQQWVENIKADEYMPRFYPREFKGNIKDTGLCLWFIIVEDGYDVGTI